MMQKTTLPNWNMPPHQRSELSDVTYLKWLGEERERLIREGELTRLLADPCRQPVDVRFVWRE